jgi:aspartate/methionine/tyrosine aminotransferase
MDGLQGDVPPGGTVLFPHSSVDVGKLANRLLNEYGTVIAEGRFFGVPDHFRLGLGGETGELRKGLANLRRSLRSMS